VQEECAELQTKLREKDNLASSPSGDTEDASKDKDATHAEEVARLRVQLAEEHARELSEVQQQHANEMSDMHAERERQASNERENNNVQQERAQVTNKPTL
jgi:hypothetical protein